MPHYRVRYSEKVLKELRSLRREAEAVGQGEAIDRSFRIILEGISADPMSFGEAQFTYRKLKLTHCVVLLLPLAMEYAVDESRHIVYLCRAKLL
jgi:hypothetical protein